MLQSQKVYASAPGLVILLHNVQDNIEDCVDDCCSFSAHLQIISATSHLKKYSLY